MILIIGGAYQGKLKYARENYKEKQSICECMENSDEINFEKDIINSFHMFILSYIKRDENPIDYITENIDKFKDKIIICDDISCGIVPIDSKERQWREITGRCLGLLSNSAEQVIRVFCGLGMRLK